MTRSEASAPRQNIELKARLADLDAARRTAVALCGNNGTVERQKDTYFRCPRGRLKLRQIEGESSRLIAYARADEPRPRASDYRLVEVADGETLCAALADVLGIAVVVEKQREIFLYNNVRIHLDRVEGLGTFIEFEAVLASPAGQAEGARQVRELSQRFGLQPHDLVAASYSDLLLSAGP